MGLWFGVRVEILPVTDFSSSSTFGDKKGDRVTAMTGNFINDSLEFNFVFMKKEIDFCIITFLERFSLSSLSPCHPRKIQKFPCPPPNITPNPDFSEFISAKLKQLSLRSCPLAASPVVAKSGSRRKATTFGDIMAASPSPLKKKAKSSDQLTMASLPSISRKVVTTVEEDDDAITGSDWDSNDSFEIELISGGTTIDGAYSHRIKWRGCHETYKDWWQVIPEGHDVSGNEYSGMKATVFNLEQAPKVSAGDQCKGRFYNVVLGEMKGSNTRVCFTADGVTHTIDLLSCRFDDTPKDWLLDLDLKHRLLTDSILGEAWISDPVLKRARTAWCNGKYLPVFDDVIAILRYANAAIRNHPWLSVNGRQAITEIGLFLCDPRESQRMLIRGHADTLRRFFLADGLIYDCLTVCLSIEAKDIAEFRVLVTCQNHRDPSAAAFDTALAQGKL